MGFNKDTGEWIGYIYCIENIVNHKRYVGQTIKTVEQRWLDHVHSAKYEHKLAFAIYRAIRKYELHNFIIYQIELIKCMNKDDLLLKLNEAEKYYIDKLGTYKNGYNMTLGGDTNPTYLTCKKVNQYNTDLELINTFESIADASRYTGVDQSTIIDCCKQKCNTAGNYFWSYYGYLPSFSTKTRKKRVCQYSLDGILIKVWNQINETKILGNNMPDSVTKCCKGKIETSGGYVWRYYGDLFEKYPLLKQKPKILQYTIDNIFIAEYKSVSEASELNNISTTSIYKVLNDNAKSSKSFIWKYAL